MAGMTSESKGNVLAAVGFLAQALAFQNNRADSRRSIRLALVQLLAPERDQLVAVLKEHLGNDGTSRAKIITAEEAVDFILKEVGR